jgi:HlyD family secretion protein
MSLGRSGGLLISMFEKLERSPMTNFAVRRAFRKLPALMTTAAALCCLAAQPTYAADDDAGDGAPKGATVTVLKAAKACFPAIVEVSGIVRPH